MSTPTYSFEKLLNSPQWIFRMSNKNSRTVDDENGIHLIDPKSKKRLMLPTATSDDPFPGLTCEDLIDAIFEWNWPVPVFSSTHDIGWWLYFALMQFRKPRIGLEDTVRLTVIKTKSLSGSQLLESNAAEILEAMSEYKKPNPWIYAAAIDFAKASSQHLHCDVAREFIVYSYEFNLQTLLIWAPNSLSKQPHTIPRTLDQLEVCWSMGYKWSRIPSKVSDLVTFKTICARIKRDGLDRPQVVHRRPFKMIDIPLPPLANLSASMAAKLAIKMRRSKPIGKVMTSTAGLVSQAEPRISYTALKVITAKVDSVDDIIAGLGRVKISGEGSGVEGLDEVSSVVEAVQ